VRRIIIVVVENIRDFLSRFTEEELVGRRILRGQARLLQLRSVDPLITLMQEQNIQRLECQDCTWFLDQERTFNNPNNPNNVFDYQNVHLNPHYRGYRLVDSDEPDDEVESLVTEAKAITFGLERDLQRALRANIEELGLGLRILDEGRERTVAAGRIDITAEDEEGNLVIIELKAGIAPPDSLTQLLAYMGALRQEEQKPVRGILVAQDFHDRVVWGVQAVPGVQLKEYSFRFFFKDR
jgi:hypothetical protein